MSNSQSDNTDPSAALAPAGGDNGALWSFTGVELIEISPELTLLLDPVSEKRLLVKKEVGICLTHCGVIAAARARRISGGHPAPTRRPGGAGHPGPATGWTRLMTSAESVMPSLMVPVGKTPLPPVQVYTSPVIALPP